MSIPAAALVWVATAANFGAANGAPPPEGGTLTNTNYCTSGWLAVTNGTSMNALQDQVERQLEVDGASDFELLEILLGRALLPEKLQALSALVTRENTAVRAYVVAELEGRAMHPDWRRALISAAEQTRVPDSDERARLGRGLLRQAEVLSRDSSNARFVWKALRRFGSIAQATDAGLLRPFLAARGAKDRQAALQAIQAIFSHELLDTQDAIDLRTEVVRLARKYLDSDFLVSPETVALAASTVLAARAMRAPETEELLRVVRSLNRPGLTAAVSA